MNGFSTSRPASNMRFLALQRNKDMASNGFTRFDAVWNYVVYGPVICYHVVVATIVANFALTVAALATSYNSLASDNMYYASAWLFVIVSGALNFAWAEEWLSTLARDNDSTRVRAQQNAARSVLCSWMTKWLLLGGFLEVFTATYKYDLDTNFPKIVYDVAGWSGMAVGGSMWVIWTLYWSKRGFKGGDEDTESTEL